MQIEVAPQQRMSETGSSLLRLIQNNEMPLWDLLVREAVQNSLDAALGGEGFVQVDFSIHNFKRSQFSKYFEGIRERMNELYTNDTYRLLEIRDSNTSGLTGPLHEADLNIRNYGNLIKLVYHVGMPQQKEGAGGSWGLGKTVYYRMGIGLVIFYSRISEGGKYSSRLAACLVEDEERDDALLKNMGNHRGIAWWGQKTSDGNTTIPLTDDEEIQEILDALGVKPFEKDQTGTAVIIPFLRDDLRPVHDENNNEDSGMKRIVPWWNLNDIDYIKVALQRWYAPRLMNEHYMHGRWLKATVNGRLIGREDFLPSFDIVQKLYNSAIKTRDKKEVQIEGLSTNLYVSPINLRGNFVDGSAAGWLAFGRFSASDLKMTPPHNNYSPWIQMFGREHAGELNPAIMCFTRKPGMIIGYESVGKWTDGISKSPSEEYTIGIFVANSANRLKEEFNKPGSDNYTLEEYIRGCEKADHASWQDWTPDKKNPLIIDKIQRQVVRVVENQYKTGQDNVQPAKNLLLGKLLARAILPPEGFGGLGSVQRSVDGKRSTRKKVRATAPVLRLVSSPSHENGLVKINFELLSGKLSDRLALKLGAVTESASMDPETWEQVEKGTGTTFPAEIVRIELETVDKSEFAKIGWSLDGGVTGFDPKKIERILKTSISDKTIGFRIFTEKNRAYSGAIWVKSNDPFIHLSLHTEPILEEVRS